MSTQVEYKLYIGGNKLPRMQDILFIATEAGLSGVSVSPSIGTWLGEREQGYVITHIGAIEAAQTMRLIGRVLLHFMGYQTVLFTSHTVNTELIDD